MESRTPLHRAGRNDKMKILYFTTNDPKYGFTKEIESSLKTLGHTVETINDQEFDIHKLVEKVNGFDMFLFHQGGIYTDSEINYTISLERLKQLLQVIKCKKVCWFLDKGWFLNNRTLEEIIPLTDYTFLNDGNWARRHKYENVYELHAGAPKPLKGKPREEYKCEIAYYGEIHGFRKPFIDLLKKTYGKEFKIFNNVYGQDLADLITSAKMVFTPVQPNEDFYWCNRIYEILAHGGIAVYPKLEGLKEEGFVSEKHYFGYKRPGELIEIINDVIDGKKTDGQEFVKQFSYKNRLKELLSICQTNQK